MLNHNHNLTTDNVNVLKKWFAKTLRELKLSNEKLNTAHRKLNTVHRKLNISRQKMKISINDLKILNQKLTISKQKLKISNQKLKKIEHHFARFMKCPIFSICFDVLSDVRIICDHFFCKSCMNWFERVSNSNLCCSLCRMNLRNNSERFFYNLNVWTWQQNWSIFQTWWRQKNISWLSI